MPDYWGMFLAKGIAVSVLGLAAIIAPPIAGLLATVVFGWLFSRRGDLGLVTTLRAREAPGFWMVAALGVGSGDRRWFYYGKSVSRCRYFKLMC